MSYPVQTCVPKTRAYCHLTKPDSVARPTRTVRLANNSSYKDLLVKGSWNRWFLLHWTMPKKKRLNSLDKIETCHGAVLVLTHELVFICSYFSPMLPPFCFWNSMYRKVLEKKASVDGSATVLSLCFSLLISSIKSWITVFVICGIPFSKKYKYLKMVKLRGFTQAEILYTPENK